MAPNSELTKGNPHNFVNLIFLICFIYGKNIDGRESLKKKKKEQITGDRERVGKSTNTVWSGKCHNEYP